MSQSTVGTEKTLVAGADLSASLYFFVKLNASGNLVLGAAGTDNIVGIVQNNDGGSGAGATYRFGGTSKVKLGGTVAIGDWVTSDAAGKGVATTTDGNVAVRALEAGVNGDIIEVQFPLQTIFIA